jgi:hypothetical protein
MNAMRDVGFVMGYWFMVIGEMQVIGSWLLVTNH